MDDKLACCFLFLELKEAAKRGAGSVEGARGHSGRVRQQHERHALQRS